MSHLLLVWDTEYITRRLICMWDSPSITISKIQKSIIFVLLFKNHTKQTHYLTFCVKLKQLVLR